MTDHAAARRTMVSDQIASRGVSCPAVLAAMRGVERHRFIPADNRDLAYRDGPVAIGEGQTISQPYLVALMTEALGVSPGMRVLEIGTGSGYQAAVLSRLGARVTSVEIRPGLAERARVTLHEAGAEVDLRIGNGFVSLEEAPFARIIVTAAPPSIPPALIDQLAIGGRMLIPTGPRTEQTLWQLDKTAEGATTSAVAPVRFVPMTDDR